MGRGWSDNRTARTEMREREDGVKNAQRGLELRSRSAGHPLTQALACAVRQGISKQGHLAGDLFLLPLSFPKYYIIRVF